MEPQKSSLSGHISGPADYTEMELIISPETALIIIKRLSEALEDPIVTGIRLKTYNNKITLIETPDDDTKKFEHGLGEILIQIDKSKWAERLAAFNFKPQEKVR